MASPNYRAVAIKAAQRNGIDPNLFVRQINQESGFNPNARSSAGAVGIAQIVPHWHPGVDANDPVASLNYAAHLMGTLVKKYGDYASALSVYNSGSPTAYKDPKFSGGQTYNYVKDILGGATSEPPTSPGPALTTPTPGASLPGVGALLRQSLAATDKSLGLTPLTVPLPGFSVPSSTMPLPKTAGSYPTLPVTSLPLSAGMRLSAVPLGISQRSGIQVNSKILAPVESIARQFGVTVSSGYRSSSHNAAVGGASDSDHLRGNAVDFVGTPKQVDALYAWAQGKFPYIEPMSQAHDHVHISFIR